MPSILDEPIEMLQPPGRSGGRFIWRGREHRVSQVGGQWVQGGRWWLGEGCRRYFRIMTHDRLTLHLCYDELAQSWTVAEALD